jgi:hypothetical protein
MQQSNSFAREKVGNGAKVTNNARVQLDGGTIGMGAFRHVPAIPRHGTPTADASVINRATSVRVNMGNTASITNA